MDELNSPKRIEIRRHHNQLKVTSNGIMILGVWSILKTFLLMVSGVSVSSDGTPFDASLFNIIALSVMFLILLAIDLRLRLVIWRGARREAYGRNTNNRYLVLTIILIVISVISLCSLCYSLVTDSEDRVNRLASILVESTSLAIMCELVYSGFSLRKIRKEIELDDQFKAAKMEVS